MPLLCQLIADASCARPSYRTGWGYGGSHGSQQCADEVTAPHGLNEPPFAWLHHYRRLAIRYERREELHQACLDLACALIGLKALRRQSKELCKELCNE